MEPKLLRTSDPRYLLKSENTALKGLATQSKAQKKLYLKEVLWVFEMKLCDIMEKLNQRHNRYKKAKVLLKECFVDSDQQWILSTQMLQVSQKTTD